MRVKRAGGMLWWRFGELEEIPGLVHGIFGPDNYGQAGYNESFNLSLSASVPRWQVLNWRLRLGNVLGFGELVYLHQVHGDRIFEADRQPGWGPDSPAGRYDAAITRARGQGLVIQVADCQAVLLVDPQRKVVANVHAGWRGSVAGLPAKVVKRMAASYGCRPHDLVCAIGPSLGPCCAEFVNYRRQLPAEFVKYKDCQERFDFWRITTDQLKETGVRPEKIFLSHICTCCNPGLFYSYRGQKTDLRFAAVIGFL